MKKPELLSPAGNLEKLKIALSYGADAVYASVGAFSLRQRSAKEFSKETFREGVEFTHKMGKKFYATINGFPFNAQLDKFKTHIEFLKDLGVDAFIIASPSIISLAKKIAPDTEIHLSTQANVMNYMDAQIYYDMGVKRVVVAREIGLKDVISIKEKVPNLDIEIFIHGSMCFAYSGRCLISALQSGRFSNRGSCANDCRFNYEIYAKNDESGALFKLNEDENGTYIMNSKDLNLSSYVEKIMQSGAVDSFKIEGRTKSQYYAACATNAYRMAIDDALSGRFNAEIYQKELHTLKNRGFTDGYLVSRPFERKDTQNFNSTLEEGTHQVCAITLDGEFFDVKFKISKNTPYEILAPKDSKIETIENEIGKIYEKYGKFWLEFKVLKAKNNKEFDEIHSGNLNQIISPVKLPNFSFLRKEIK